MPHWSAKTLTELEDLYWSHVAPDLRDAGIDPNDPSATAVTQRARGLDYALREHHELTVGQFLDDVVGVETPSTTTPRADNPYPSRVEDAPKAVRDRFREYVDSLTSLGNSGMKDTTIATKQSRLAAYVDAYTSAVDGDLFARLQDPDQKPEEVRRVTAAIEHLSSGYESQAAMVRILDETKRWYTWMEDDGRIAYNPVAVVERRSGYEREAQDNPALSTSQVRTLYQTADSLEERLLVVMLCAWGLRTGEVASLRVNQLVLEGDDPHVVFEPGERKNNPDEKSTVAIIHGRDAVEDRLNELAARDEWSGYLWPSTTSRSGHVAPSTIRRRFQALAERADVTVDGGEPVPKMGRRFWYDSYTDAMGELVERVEQIAADQGSASAEVVLSNYVDEDARRRERRRAMHDRLQEAFDGGK